MLSDTRPPPALNCTLNAFRAPFNKFSKARPTEPAVAQRVSRSTSPKALLAQVLEIEVRQCASATEDRRHTQECHLGGLAARELGIVVSNSVKLTPFSPVFLSVPDAPRRHNSAPPRSLLRKGVLMRQAMYDSQSPPSARADRCVRRHRIGSPRLAFPFLWLRRDLHKSARRAEPRRAAAGSSSPARKTQILIFLSSAKYLFNFSQPNI